MREQRQIEKAFENERQNRFHTDDKKSILKDGKGTPVKVTLKVKSGSQDQAQLATTSRPIPKGDVDPADTSERSASRSSRRDSSRNPSSKSGRTTSSKSSVRSGNSARVGRFADRIER